MNRKKFIKNSALSAFSLGALKASGSTQKKEKEQLGHNHIPNHEIKRLNTVLHKANTRGGADHGWLKAKHSFSFANYQNPERMHFGKLRVLNDDTIAAAKGFGMHPHKDMEIITIPLSGNLEHKDSMGNTSVIKSGEIQVMSAGTGVYHSEFNANKDREVKLLQIWVFPNKNGHTPRYDQISIKELYKPNQFFQILSNTDQDQGVFIHQDAWFHMGEFEPGKKDRYTLKSKNSGVYLFVIDGEVQINDQALEPRDGFGIWNTDQIELTSTTKSKVLLIEVPL